MKKLITIYLVTGIMMAAVNFASADTIRGIGMDFVTIGNPGNAADTGGTPGCGAVSYNYRIGKYEVTNAQWNAFTDLVGAPTGNAYFTGAQQPTNCVSWYEATQFCNYLTSGDKSKGAYLFSGDNTNLGVFLGINRDAAISSYGIAYVIPTEDEWYKAAYFKPNGNGYSLFANGTNTPPSTSQACTSFYPSPWDFGSGTMEQNGTFDMMGNVWEWNETLISGSNRGLRGGAFYVSPYYCASSAWTYTSPYDEYYGIGFRVASVPEPCSLVLLSLGGLALLRKRRA